MHPTRIRPLTARQLVSHCPGGEPGPELSRLLGDAPPAWALAAQEVWGLAGMALVSEERSQALVLVCQGLHLPAGHPLGRFPRGSDAGYLLALCVDEAGHAGAGTRQLVQALCRTLRGRVSTLEIAAHPWAGPLAPPVPVLEQAGFHQAEQRADGLCRLTVELERGVRWRPDLNQAWQALAGWVPAQCPPASAGREGGMRHGRKTLKNSLCR